MLVTHVLPYPAKISRLNSTPNILPPVSAFHHPNSDFAGDLHCDSVTQYFGVRKEPLKLFNNG